LRLEGYNLVQTHPDYPALKATNDVINYNRWTHVNEMSKENILTSLTPELYTKLQEFDFASNMLEFLEVKFGEHYLIPEQDTDIEKADVFSIQSEVLKLKQPGLLDAEVNY
jgi:GTP cyclohydrolase III